MPIPVLAPGDQVCRDPPVLVSIFEPVEEHGEVEPDYRSAANDCREDNSDNKRPRLPKSAQRRLQPPEPRPRAHQRRIPSSSVEPCGVWYQVRFRKVRNAMKQANTQVQLNARRSGR